MTRDTCNYETATKSGVYYCNACHPEDCPHPALFCKVKDRRDELMSFGQPHETLWELLQKGIRSF